MTDTENENIDSQTPEESLEALDQEPEKPGIKLPPAAGWGRALIMAAILCALGAVYLAKSHDESLPKKEDEPQLTETEKELLAINAGDVENEVILAEGSVEAPPLDEGPEAPGGLSWEELVFPGSERLLKFLGKDLVEGERAYVAEAPYMDVKMFYTDLIKKSFFMEPEMSEFNDGNRISLVLKNKTGSLTVRIQKMSSDDRVHILVTRLKNMAEGNLKPFGGPTPEDGE